ncbi:methyltransferase domain-containing protein [Actinocorallia sp. API 0066]|uniref:class I SAM-dependent methyltransferase n=1 Tax=Actinocorallia sp. API 0066 TaxID=2896846 RepID=UPI001E2C35FC|nr:methyltransferase domain-containing protein [Actinocorallia sp. API 0066]MCD0448574.1 methyltransferase domain-containing protein [Actinocorallia sp. API 0066]
MNASEAKAAVAALFDKTAESYEELGVEYFAPMGRALVERAGVAPGERVLDVGCGRGHVLFPAAAAAGPRGTVVGTDLAPGMVARTAEAAADLPWVSVALGDAAEPDFPDGTFDVVLAGLVLFFLPVPEEALAAYTRVLRPGGRLAFSTFARHDPVFGGTVKALAALCPPGQGERPADRFEKPEEIRALLTLWEAVEITEVPVETRFSDLDHVWRWLWTHGMRGLLESIPTERLDEAREAAYAALSPAVEGEEVVLRTRLRVTTAVRPG